MKKGIILLAVLLALSVIFKAKAQSGTYVVLTSISDTTDDYYDAVQALSDYRSAQIITFDPNDIDALLPVLTGIEPRYAAVVLKPLELNINLVREFLMMSTNIDDDVFTDFAYGYITGATGQDALDFVNNIIYAESQDIQNFPLNVSGYAASSLNAVYTMPGDYMTYLNPPSYSSIYLETNDSGVGVDYFQSNTGYMENNKLLDIGHNGDPHMLWLFEGGNIDPDPPVWDYDPDKIEDTAYARAGLTSEIIGAIDLYPAVAFNGACHAGVPKKVLVEGDIAGTFGDTQGLIKFYEMSDTFSFALSILKTGITGYFAPCGSNNANDQAEEVLNAFLFNEPLGDIHKRSHDGVVMGFLGNRPSLRIFEENESVWLDDIYESGTFNPDDWSGAAAMLGGKANRIYFGDPLYNPFALHHSASLEITQTTLDSIDPGTLDIYLTYDKPDVYEAYFPVWDKFHNGNTMIYTPVDLPDYCGEILSFEVIDNSDVYDLAFYAVEDFDNKRIMHIEVDIPNDMYDAIDYDITFRITFENTEITDPDAEYFSITAYPNPSKNITTFRFRNPGREEYTLIVINANGQEVRRIEGITENTVTVENSGLESGLYLYRLIGSNGITGSGKYVVE